MKLYNRPKLPKDKTDPPDIRSKIDADVKAGHEKFRVSGEVVKSPANSILLDGAEALPKQEKK
jgi:hypothetical protein